MSASFSREAAPCNIRLALALCNTRLAPAPCNTRLARLLIQSNPLTSQMSQHTVPCRIHLGGCNIGSEALVRRVCNNGTRTGMLSPQPLERNPVTAMRSWMNHRPEIPKLLHQTWRDCQLPPLQSEWRKRCDVVLHSDWAFWLWTDADNRDLVARDFPEHIDLYDGYKLEIERVDLFRLLVLFRHGGVYMDLDITCLRPFEAFPYLQSGMAIFGWQDHKNETICNAFIAAPPAHPFIAFLINRAHSNTTGSTSPLDVTGPSFVTQGFWAWQHLLPNSSGVLVHPFPLIYPYGPGGRPSLNPCRDGSPANLDKCSAMLNTSFIATFWTKTWMPAYASSMLKGTVKRPTGGRRPHGVSDALLQAWAGLCSDSLGVSGNCSERGRNVTGKWKGFWALTSMGK